MKTDEADYSDIRPNEENTAVKSYEHYHYLETRLLDCVRNRDTESAKAFLYDILEYTQNLSGSLEQQRYIAVQIATLISRAAINSGVPAEKVHLLLTDCCGRYLADGDFKDLSGELQEILITFIKMIEIHSSDSSNKYVRKALRIIYKSYARSLTLSFVSKAVGLSSNYFSTLFQQSTGESFSSYVNRIRIEESKRLLLSSEDPIAQIAVSIGFTDQSYFCRVFRRFVGMSPRQYRSTGGNLG